ncbi:Stealth CR1 domain-containing protein [Paratractidigestivibacter sp.]
MLNIQTDIDFIVTWVDGSDPQWQSDYAKSGGS